MRSPDMFEGFGVRKSIGIPRTLLACTNSVASLPPLERWNVQDRINAMEREMNMETALQTRVEESRSELIQLVSFRLDQEEYGVNVLKVREIIRMPAITRVPNTPHYIEGVINLRGKVIPIISMRKRFNLPEVENGSQTRIMVMDMEGELMGFIVDAVSEVIRIAESEIQPPPAVVNSAVEQECLSGVINQTDRLLFFLDLEKLVSRDDRQFFSSMM